MDEHEFNSSDHPARPDQATSRSFAKGNGGQMLVPRINPNTMPSATDPFPKSEFELMLEEVTHKSWFGDKPRGDSHRLPEKLDAALCAHCDNTSSSLGPPYRATLGDFRGEIETQLEFPEWNVDQPNPIPSVFYAALEDYLFFYITTVYPYFLSLKETSPEAVPITRRGYGNALSPIELSIRERRIFRHGNLLLAIIWLSSPCYDGLSSRFKAGLLRAAQVRLIEIWYRCTIMEQAMLIRSGADAARIWRSWQGCGMLTRRFFTRIRSERIELLLLKYISEPGYNRDVALGIAAADDAHDRYLAEQLAPYETYHGHASNTEWKDQAEKLVRCTAGMLDY
ncbi:hypothetical protein BJ508DRAFT_418312 [Ascobolus immersus RN42]|uniref:Uncharacterized protein n=1 Tax=Ascobolus immersus RN42 TaxID=1160509 RepID=A0A3N4HTF6_ASCIM|nr:hypothetical protein BJ508DRAFT_418312 [Ascobolus immersus RN42]